MRHVLVSLGLPRPDLVEADARRFDGLERFLLQLQRARTFRRARERAARNRPMIRTLGALELLECRGVLVLPLEPARQPVDRRRLGRTRTLDAERIAIVVAHGLGEPLPVALGGDETIFSVTK